MQGAGIVDVDGRGGDPEYLVAILKPEDMFIGPVTQSAVLGQAVAADTRSWEDHVAVGGAHFDGVDHLDEVHPVAFVSLRPDAS